MVEREHSWGQAYEGVLSLHAGQQIEQCKKYKKKVCGLRWLRYNISHATTNQKHTGAMERVYKSRCNYGGVRRGDDTVVLVGIRS
jgi:hypothetical protein